MIIADGEKAGLLDRKRRKLIITPRTWHLFATENVLESLEFQVISW